MQSLDPHTEALVIGLARTGIGVGALLLPRTASRLLFKRRPSGQTALAVRMLAGREIALGLGAALAARRRAAALRGWVEAGALADATDVVALLADGGPTRRVVRIGGIATAAVATTWGVRLADRLAD